MDTMRTLGEISLGSRMKRLSDQLMRETQQLYKDQNVDFDPYLFPAFHNIAQLGSTTNTELNESLLMTQPAITQTINKLLQKELIALETDSGDKRKKIITLSEKGSRLFHHLRPVWKIMHETIKQYTSTPANTLVEHITQFEDALKNGKIMRTIEERIENELKVQIVDYKDEYKQYFYDFNIEWLETWFYVEEFDKEVLSKPDKYILEPGGHIFFAKYGDEIIGTVALMKYGGNGYELTKMAVTPLHRGKKAGQLLMQYCIDFAREHKFDNLMLYSNTVLENAIYIYRKYGFIEVPVEPDSPYDRSNIKMVLDLR